MDRKSWILFVLTLTGLYFCCAQAQEGLTAGPGYITALNLSAIQEATYWQGYYGEINVGGASGSNTVTASGGSLHELNLYFTSNCSIASLTGEIYASTSPNIQWATMSAGTTSEVDGYLDLDPLDIESGTSTFTANKLYDVAGSNINAPATYTFVDNAPSIVFDTGVLNDSYSTVYVSQIQDDSEGFEAENATHDFQMLIPVPLGTNPTYYFSAELNIVCAPLDLKVNESDLSYALNPVEGQTIVLTAEIHNLENGSYSDFTVSFFVDDLLQASNILSIEGLGSQTTQFSWVALEGTHNLTVEIDPLGNVVETDKSNNEATGSITVSSLNPPQDQEMSVHASGRCVGEAVSISAESGGDPVSGADIDIYLDGSHIESTSTNSQGLASFTPEEEGSYDIYASRSGYEDAETNIVIEVCESCTDGIQNQDESDVDCGGSCGGCEDDMGCSSDDDCESSWCYGGLCKTSTCSDGLVGPGESDIDCGGICPPCESCTDGIQNQDESDVDCGGSCGGCAEDESCFIDSDCSSNWCHEGTCEVESCVDGALNQDESDVDCGGVCLPCSEGRECEENRDCASRICFNGICVTDSCFDGLLNQDETGVDCGGSCPKCSEDEPCLSDSDCLSGWCDNGTCNAPSCFDGVLNQDESDVDCGGSCGGCAEDESCFIDSDCLSGWCLAGTCLTQSCFDGVLNQDETSIDCGGSCLPCSEGESCLADPDCLSGWCNNGSCSDPSCFDGFKNQGEIGVDCGGSCLPCECFNGVRDANETGVDCGGICPRCECMDGILNGDESDVDCGGSCSPCGEGRGCEENRDCQSGWCFDGTCQRSSCEDGIKSPREEDIDCGGVCAPCHCFDGVQNEGETGIDCGGTCPSCRFIRVITNETDTGETVVYTYNSTTLCLNKKKDKGETDVDCGGHCAPCVKGLKCIVNTDCRSGFCSDGVCTISSCNDHLLGPREEKIDCGGPCGECPWLKILDRAYVNENMTISVMNPLDGLVIDISGPGAQNGRIDVLTNGRNPYFIADYCPNMSGLYLIRIEGYDEKYLKVRKRSMIPILDEVPDEVRSLLMPTLMLAAFIYWLKKRRVKVVVDEAALKRFAAEDLLYWGLVKSYGRVYTAAEIQTELLGIKQLMFLELDDKEISEAEDLSDQYGIPFEAAKALTLSRRLRAKKCIMGTELPEELMLGFKGVKVVSVESEFKLMRI